MLRRYEPDDLEDLLDAWEAASAVVHSFLGGDFLAQERLDLANVYLPNAETWVWEDGGRVVGFLSLLPNDEVGGLFVHPRYHRSGIGRALMDKARALRGALEVEVFEQNVLGRAFYSGYGFELMHEKTEEHTGFPALRLRMER